MNHSTGNNKRNLITKRNKKSQISVRLGYDDWVAENCLIGPAFRSGPAAGVSPLRLKKGRGALSNASGRFEKETRLHEDDGWEPA